MELELISFKLCPFMQPAVITLLHKNIEHKVTYIDINDPPLWFDEISPTGQVPLLRIDNQSVVFESAVINEYLDEITSGGMMPNKPLPRALNRSWMLFCGTFFNDIFNLVGARDKDTVEDFEYDIHEKLDRVESCKSDSRFFNGDKLSLIDTSYAALFMRLDLVKSGLDILDSKRFPRLAAWSQSLLALDCVKQSMVAEFPDMYHGMIKMREGWIADQL